MPKTQGEIEFVIGGKTYTFLLGTYALSKLEQNLKQPWQKVLQELDPTSIRLWLAVFHCGLLLHHEPMSEREASILLDELTVNAFAKRFVEIGKGQFPANDGDAARPTMAAVKANNGIGTASSAIG